MEFTGGEDSAASRELLATDVSAESDSETAMLGNVLDDILEIIGFGKTQIRLLFLCAIGYMAVCAELLVAVFLSDPITDDFHISNLHFAILPCLSTLVSLLSSLIFGIAADFFGRKTPFLVSISFVVIGGIASAFAPNFMLLCICRCIVSVGIGGLAAVDYVLFLEFTPKQSRGQFSLVITLFGSMGVLFESGMAWLLLSKDSIHGWDTWRYLLLISVIPMLICLVCRVCFAHESPRFLMTDGQYTLAWDILCNAAQLNGIGMESILPFKQRFMNQSADNSFCETGLKGKAKSDIGDNHLSKLQNIFQLFAPAYRRSTIALCFIWIFQGCAYWGLTLFLPSYFDRIGVNPYLGIFSMVASELPGLITVSMLVDCKHPCLGRLGTMRLFGCGAIASCIITIFLSIDIEQTEAGLVVCSCLIYFFMCPIWGILFTYSPELYSVNLRGTAMAFFQMIQSIPGLFTPFLSAFLVNQGHKWLYLTMWMAFLIASLLSSFALRVETAQKAMQ